MKKLHESHQGIQSTLRRARDVVFWPGMTSHITEAVEMCDTCNKFRNKQQREPIISHPVPDRPWERVGADIFEHDNSTYLVITDYYSNYFELQKLTTMTASNVIKICKTQFARHGIPDILITDSGS